MNLNNQLENKMKNSNYYSGQFIGDVYYNIGDVKKAFPSVKSFGELEAEGFDLSDTSSNVSMIEHHVKPFRKVGIVI
jgi:hypothetical protein